MKLSTAIGTIVLETDWAPLLHFMQLRDSPLPCPEEREVTLTVEQVDRSEIGTAGNDLPDAYPRRVYVEGCEFILSRD